MRRFVFFVIVIVAAASCRTSKTLPPRTNDTAGETAGALRTEPPAISVESPDADFRAPQPDGGPQSEDIAAAERAARDAASIRDAFFEFDASTLDDDARGALDQTATWLRSHPEARVGIEGHCDERGTEQYNLALGDRRAFTAASYLATLGVAHERMSTVSYGEERPFETASTEEAWAQNRRAHIVVAPRR